MNSLRPILLALTLSLSMPLLASDKAEGPQIPYLELQPSIVVNLIKGGKHLRFDVQLMLADQATLTDIKPHVPAIISELILLASGQDGTELKTPEGKEGLRKTALNACNAIIKQLTGKDQAVKELFFTQFFVR